MFAAYAVRTLCNVLKLMLSDGIAQAGDKDSTFYDCRMLTGFEPHLSTVDLLPILEDSFVGLREGGWARKPFMLLASRFQQVILVDADAGFSRSWTTSLQRNSG